MHPLAALEIAARLLPHMRLIRELFPAPHSPKMIMFCGMTVLYPESGQAREEKTARRYTWSNKFYT